MKVTKEMFERITTLKPSKKKHNLFSLYLIIISVKSALKALKYVTEGLRCREIK